TRWLPHSVFSHDSHRPLQCLECHPGVPESRLTSDVLMPAIESCRKCHTGTERGARSDCVECHTYHPAPARREASHDLAIEAFLRGLGRHPSAKVRTREPAQARP